MVNQEMGKANKASAATILTTTMATANICRMRISRRMASTLVLLDNGDDDDDDDDDNVEDGVNKSINEHIYENKHKKAVVQKISEHFLFDNLLLAMICLFLVNMESNEKQNNE